MAKIRILVVSSANIDLVQRVTRVPYSGETIMEENNNYMYVPGGKGANAAIALARIGADCLFSCRVGNDANGRKLITMYEKEGIDTRYVMKDDMLPTGLASILVEDNGNNRIICYPGANNAMDPADIEECFISYPDAVFLQMEIPTAAIIETARRANLAGIPIFIDAGPAKTDFPFKKLGKIEIFSPNETETRAYTGIAPTGEESAYRAAVKLSTMVDAKYIVMKWGARGAFVYDGRDAFTVPAEDVVPVDTTAAGDVFSAVMTHVYMETKDIVLAVKYANIAAGISVTRPGASTSIPTRGEVLAYVKNKLKNKDTETSSETADE